MNNFKPVALGAGAFFYSLLSFSVALADDTEIYVPKATPSDQYVRPNILFILDSSGSMDTEVAGTKPVKTRNEVLQTVVKNLIDQIKVKEDVNVGFMRYDGREGGYVISAVKQLTNGNAKSMKDVVDAIPADGSTPLLETYYESYLYMAGKNRKWGDKSVAASLSGDKYITPITHSCQKNHIIYVTDGEPQYDTDSNTDVKNLLAKTTLLTSLNTDGSIKDNNITCGTGNGACLPHLAEYMNLNDLWTNATLDPGKRKQTVNSHFIGFTVDLPLLKNAAQTGGGRYYTSNNVSGLTDALKAIIVDITADNTSFAAPSVAVSAFNNLGYRNALYYALFRPAEGTNWPGNVKRYKLGNNDNNTPANKTDDFPMIVDKTGTAAIDDSTGFFTNSSSSFWSSLDGSDVAKGGVAGQLTSPDARKLLTWTASDRTPTASAGVSGSASLENLNDSNTGITQSLLGATSAAERTLYINWARGKNPDGTARLAVGDVLHNEPKLVAYITDEDLARAGNSELPTDDPLYQTSPEQLYLFFGDNEGYLRAINPVNGSEKWAFMPKELLSNPGAYYRNAKGSENKRYGMDGLINVWTEYSALNSTTKTRTISKAYLYAGMRRGGSTYYSLDVTNIDTPKLKWMIKGPKQTSTTNTSGVTTITNDATSATPGYEKLGNTYSAPKLADIKIGTTATKVLIFTGGYDLDQDIVGTNVRKSDDVGNALYIADAETGKLLWSASNAGASKNISTMTYSMPASPTIIDVNRDGLADIIYAADIGGQLFRFDISNATATLASIDGGRIADLGGSAALDNRRFFTTPDVAYIQERGAAPYLTISLGSGFRESPLNTDTNDRFYVLRDTNVTAKPATYETITESDLADASGVNLTDTQATTVLAAIKVLEDKMTVLNNALTSAQESFRFYKDSIGFTAKADASIAASTAALDKQRQIDQIAATNPYIATRAPETAQQSLLQNSMVSAHDALEGLENARKAAQDIADATDVGALTSSAAAAATALTTATNAYDSAKTTSDADAVTATNTNATAVASETAASNAVPSPAQAAIDLSAAITARDAAANAVANDWGPTGLLELDRLAKVDAAKTGGALELARNDAADALALNTTDLGTATTDVTNATDTLETALGGSIPSTPSLQVQRAEAAAVLPTPDLILLGLYDDLIAKTLILEDRIALETAVTVTQQAFDDAVTAANSANQAKADAIALQASTAATVASLQNSITLGSTATTDRGIANTAASTAAASAGVTATKLTTKNNAQLAKDAADLALTNADADDDAAAALTAQRDKMALQYETLINLQAVLDTAYADITSKENAILAAKADPLFPSDDIPALETALAASRVTYAGLAQFAKRNTLNNTAPKAIDLLAAVNSALASGNPSAIDSALTNLQTTLGTPGPLVNTPSALIARNESSKQTLLQNQVATDKDNTDMLALLVSQRDALTDEAEALDVETDAMADKPYSGTLLTPAQVADAKASLKYSGANLTMFDAYQYLIDVAADNANNTTTGLPALRNQINTEYGKLTIGNNYTPDPDVLAAKKGFYLRLVKGEKVLSNSVSFRKAVLFSTFSPRGQTNTLCGADVGRGKTYAVSLLDASAVFAVSTDGGVTSTPTRSFELKRSGIPPTPSVILTDNKPVFLTGTETLNSQAPSGGGVPGTLVCTKGNEALCDSGPTKSTYWRED